MSESVLDNCGKYSTRLQTLASDILEQKVKNGENVNVLDKEILESELFGAYQKILSIAGDGLSIEKAVRNLELAVKSTGRTDFEKIATTVAYEVVAKKVDSQENANIDEEMIGNEYIHKDEKLIEISKDLQVDSLIEEAKNGDTMAAGIASAIKKAVVFMGKYGELDEKKTRGALSHMKVLIESGNEEARRVAEQMAQKYNFDFFEQSENGSCILSEDKFYQMYESKVVSFNSKVKNLDTLSIIKKQGENFYYEKLQLDPNYSVEDYDRQITTEVQDFYCHRIYQDKAKDDPEGILQICEKYPDEMKRLLDLKLELYDNDKVKRPKIREKLQQEIFLLSDCMKEYRSIKDYKDKHGNFTIEKTKNEKFVVQRNDEEDDGRE